MKQVIVSSILVAFLTACSGPREYLANERSGDLTDADERIANLKRAARYPWTDEGICAVREASGEWKTLVERCYHALDLSRIRFQDLEHRCAVADVDAAAVGQMVGICLLVQPEFVVGAVVIVGMVVVAAAIAAEIESTRRPCSCVCYAKDLGPDARGQTSGRSSCGKLCRNRGYQGFECGKGGVEWF